MWHHDLTSGNTAEQSTMVAFGHRVHGLFLTGTKGGLRQTDDTVKHEEIKKPELTSGCMDT